jgi:hypothetical protein
VFWRGWVLLRQEVAWDDHAVEPRWIGLAPWGTTSGPPAPGSQHAAVSAEPPARGWCLPHPRRLPAPAAPAAARR